ncbi:hypothetical protein [Jiangella sp. DSM 45060]|uniref:hypothetical protein n=1 Tax=Jiangella sp. DSM 45060 TaxID=1798224 RepID=UPI00087DF396|nr:hypothetical protein [Jiangella sp. DSM 45060]SDS25390.1 hypothetical protein SAMN04515669_0678 [Jiangella sp. DSM 45060]
MKSTIRSRAIVPLAGIALIFATAACGSDDPPAPEPPSADELELTMTEPPPSEGADAEADDAGDDAAAAGDGDYCGLLESMGTDLLSGSAATDPDAASGLVDVYRDLAAAAPEDVAADWTAMADAMESLANIDPADPEALEELEQLGDLTEISQRLGESVQSECG